MATAHTRTPAPKLAGSEATTTDAAVRQEMRRYCNINGGLALKKACEDCRGVGLLLMQNDTHGLRIERCDTCRKYRSDDQAVTAAFGLAAKALRPGCLRGRRA